MKRSVRCGAAIEGSSRNVNSASLNFRSYRMRYREE